MPDFGPAIAAEVAAACRANAGEIAQGLSRTFDIALEVQPSEPTTLDTAAWPAGFDGPGLVVLLTVDASAAVVVLPESTGLLPAWYAQPDPTGKSKLGAMAQELGMLALPDAFMPADFVAAKVENIASALARAGAATGAGLVSLPISGGGKSGELSVVWPVARPAEIYAAPPAATPAPAAEPTPTPSPVAAPKPAPQPAASKPAAPQPVSPPHSPGRHAISEIEDLPLYTRSLLRIEVPVIVTLAAKRQSVGRIVELGPGSIIQFEKSCDQALSLAVGDQPVAEGEAVKVGDKFGIRLTSLLIPDERFKPVRPALRA